MSPPSLRILCFSCRVLQQAAATLELAESKEKRDTILTEVGWKENSCQFVRFSTYRGIQDITGDWHPWSFCIPI